MTAPGRESRAARPLQPVALGLLVVALSAPLAGYDAFADPLGWLLVLLGASRLPLEPAGRRTLLVLGGLALVVSLVLWPPVTGEPARGAEPALVWALSLPQLGFVGLLCHLLGGRAGRVGDRRPARWLRTATVLTVAAAAAPIVVLGGGVEEAAGAAAALGALTMLLVIVLLLAWGDRPWAGTAERSPDSAAERRSGP